MIVVLAKAPNSALTSQLVKTLVDYFYEKNLKKVKLFCFVPFVIYFASAIFFFSYPMINEEFQKSDEKWKAVSVISASLTLAGTCYFGIIEMIQFRYKGLSYLKGLWNYIDFASISLNLVLLANHMKKFIEKEVQVVLAFIAVTLMWGNFIFWFRVFESITFYFDLIR